MKLVKHLANLGYGSRKDVQWMFREGRITDAAGEVLYADDPLDHDNVRVDGEPVHVTALPSNSQLSLLKWQRRQVEQLRQALSFFDLHEQGLAPFGRQRQRESRGHRRLPRTALSGDDVEPHTLPVAHVDRA